MYKTMQRLRVGQSFRRRVLAHHHHHRHQNVVTAVPQTLHECAGPSSAFSSSAIPPWKKSAASSPPAFGCDVQNRSMASSMSFDTKDDMPHREEEAANKAATTPGGQDGGSHGSGGKMNPVPDFGDARAAYGYKTDSELVSALLSFSLCQVPFLVRHSETMLHYARKIFGDAITDALLKATLFGHFCAGEDEKKMQPAIQTLERAGIGSILYFAAEDDGEGDKHKGNKGDEKESAVADNHDSSDTPIADRITLEHHPKVRVYEFESEAQCDRNVHDFVKSIRDVGELRSDGYAAVKVTALGNPKLLERMSRAIVEAQSLFAKFDVDQDGYVSREEFEKGLDFFFNDDADIKLKEALDELHHRKGNNGGMVDYITWSMLLSPRDLPRITAGCREVGPLAMASPTEEEVELIEAMYERGRTLADEAREHGTRLLIDAEQVRFQPAIDNLVLDLQRAYNAVSDTDHPIIYNTYQCYLKDVPDRLKTDVERSQRYNYHFGAKLVRGAYMESERALAESLGYPSPIHETIRDTHDCYNECVDFLLRHAASSSAGEKITEVMLASHNQESIEMAIDAMNRYGIDRRDGTVSFAQLFGMSDNLTFNLGKHGFRGYKYVPYGEVKMVMPFLIRRANENSSVSSAAAREISMIKDELNRRHRLVKSSG